MASASFTREEADEGPKPASSSEGFKTGDITFGSFDEMVRGGVAGDGDGDAAGDTDVAGGRSWGGGVASASSSREEADEGPEPASSSECFKTGDITFGSFDGKVRGGVAGDGDGDAIPDTTNSRPRPRRGGKSLRRRHAAKVRNRANRRVAGRRKAFRRRRGGRRHLRGRAGRGYLKRCPAHGRRVSGERNLLCR